MSETDDAAEAERHAMLVARRLSRAITKIDSAWYFFSRSKNLHENSLSLLYALDDGEAHTQKQICADWLLPKTTVNSCVKEFAEKGWVKLLPCEKNRREKTIVFTAAGKRAAKNLLREFYAAETSAAEETLRKFSEGFADAMEMFVAQVCENLELKDEQRKRNKQSEYNGKT